MNKPTCEDLFNEKLESVKTIDDGGWRHGITRTETFYRKDDDTYWETEYRISTDGETHELREGLAEVYKVKPVEVKEIQYVLDKDFIGN